MNPDLVRIKHMIVACEEIIEFSKGKTKDDLFKDRKLNLALVHLLEIIGEAGNKISVELKHKYEHVPWNALVGMRNRLIHGYYDIDLNIVWETINRDIPPLVSKLKFIMEKENA